MSGTPSRSTRWAALDGLRAIAVAMVVAFHAEHLLPGGFQGVDVFFVLSGFLITTLLLAEADRTGTVDLVRFWGRRIFRLTSALVVVCAALVALAVATGRRTADVVAGAIASVLYVANIWQYGGHPTPLLEHTWPLALESQFYLVWPVLLLLVRRRRWVAGLLGVVVLAAWVVAGLIGVDPVGYTYVRATGLVLGCGLALLVHHGSRLPAVLRVLAVPALVGLLAYSLVELDGGGSTGPLLVALPSLLTVPVVAGLTAPGALTTLLSARPLVWVGERSYGLYLWHFPALSMAINNAPSVPLGLRMGANVAAAAVLAMLSHTLVEQPVLRRTAALTRVRRTATVGAPTS